MQQYTHENVKVSPHLPIFCNQYEIYRQMTPSHWHDHLEIIYVLDGELLISCNDTEYILQKNQFYIVNSNQIHGTRSSGKISSLLIQIPYSFMDLYIEDYEHVRFRQCFDEKVDDKAYANMKRLLKMFSRIYDKKEKGYELLLMSKLQEFLHILYSNYSYIDENVEKDTRQLTRLKGVLQYVTENYRDPITLQEVANVASLNPEYFCRMFKHCMGVTFLEYVNLVRIDHIYEELLSTEDSITEILERNGFTNYKVFRRMFREQFGMTPSELRKMSGIISRKN